MPLIDSFWTCFEVGKGGVSVGMWFVGWLWLRCWCIMYVLASASGLGSSFLCVMMDDGNASFLVLVVLVK